MERKYLLLLAVVLVLYLCMGAAVFRATESQRETDMVAAMVEDYRHFLNNHSCLTKEELSAFINAVEEKVGSYGGVSRAVFDQNITKAVSRQVWDFPGAFTFCVTVITTIGYGHISPVSDIGRIICMLYALFGIPLTLILLRGVGEQLNNVGRKMMSLKLCFESPNVNKALNMIGVILTGLVVMFIIPTIVFIIIEGWELLPAFYYCFITLSTIGFGDLVAGDSDVIADEDSRNIYRIAVYVWILLGLAYLSLIIQAISDLFVKKAGEAQKRVANSALAALAADGFGQFGAEALARIASSPIRSTNAPASGPPRSLSPSASLSPQTETAAKTKKTTNFRSNPFKRMRLRGEAFSFDGSKNIHLVGVTHIGNDSQRSPRYRKRKRSRSSSIQTQIGNNNNVLVNESNVDDIGHMGSPLSGSDSPLDDVSVTSNTSASGHVADNLSDINSTQTTDYVINGVPE